MTKGMDRKTNTMDCVLNMRGNHRAVTTNNKIHSCLKGGRD